MKRLILAFITTMIAYQAFVISAITGKVIQVLVNQGGLGMVIFDQNVGSALASCRDSNNYPDALSQPSAAAY